MLSSHIPWYYRAQSLDKHPQLADDCCSKCCPFSLHMGVGDVFDRSPCNFQLLWQFWALSSETSNIKASAFCCLSCTYFGNACNYKKQTQISSSIQLYLSRIDFSQVSAYFFTGPLGVPLPPLYAQFGCQSWIWSEFILKIWISFFISVVLLLPIFLL